MSNTFNNGFRVNPLAGYPTPPSGNYGYQTTPAYGDNNGATLIDIKQNFSSSDAVSIIPNLILVPGSDVDLVRVTNGTVNLQTPTLSGDPINDSPPPEISTTSDVWVYVKVVGTFGSPDTYAVTIHTEADATVPSDDADGTGFISYFFLGSVVSSIIYKNHGGGNLGVESFGTINHWWVK